MRGRRRYLNLSWLHREILMRLSQKTKRMLVVSLLQVFYRMHLHVPLGETHVRQADFRLTLWAASAHARSNSQDSQRLILRGFLQAFVAFEGVAAAVDLIVLQMSFGLLTSLLRLPVLPDPCCASYSFFRTLLLWLK